MLRGLCSYNGLKTWRKSGRKFRRKRIQIIRTYPELTKVENALEALKTAEKNSQKQLQAYDKNLSKLEEQLTESLQLKLAEGLAEVSSRTKDLYDFGLKESEKSKTKINELKKEISSQAASISELSDELERMNKGISEIDKAGQKIQKSINQLSLGIIITAILAVGLVFALSKGLI